MNVEINDVEYTNNVNIQIDVTEPVLNELSNEIANQTHGSATLNFEN